MKRIYIFLFASLFCLAYTVQAQLVQNYKAKEGEGKARTAFEGTYGDSDLLLVGSLTGQYEQIPVKLEFDEQTGEATVWFYMYKSTTNDTTSTFFVVKSLMGMQAFEVNYADMGVKLPFNPSESLDDISWIDSDVMMENIRNNSDYTNFLDVYPNTQFFMGGLFVEPMQNRPVWAATFRSEDSTDLNCFVDAISGETQCLSQTTDVKIINASNLISIYPNPVADLAIVSIPLDYIDLNASLKIYDMRGNLIVSRSNLDINSDGQIAVNVNNFAPGVYSLLYMSNGNALTSRFVVVR